MSMNRLQALDVSRCQALVELNVSYTGLRSIPGLHTLPSLMVQRPHSRKTRARVCVCVCVRVCVADRLLSGGRGRQILKASGNGITSVDGLGHHTGLQELYLQSNAVRSYGNASSAHCFPDLDMRDASIACDMERCVWHICWGDVERRGWRANFHGWTCWTWLATCSTSWRRSHRCKRSRIWPI